MKATAIVFIRKNEISNENTRLTSSPSDTKHIGTSPLPMCMNWKLSGGTWCCIRGYDKTKTRLIHNNSIINILCNIRHASYSSATEGYFWSRISWWLIIVSCRFKLAHDVINQTGIVCFRKICRRNYINVNDNKNNTKIHFMITTSRANISARSCSFKEI